MKPLSVAKAATLAAAILFAAQPLQAESRLRITTPAEGEAIPSGATVTVSGEVDFDIPLPEARTFYLKGDCNPDTVFQGWLTTRLEQAGNPNQMCSPTYAWTPTNEVERIADVYEGVDGIPLTLDATRNALGNLKMHAFVGGLLTMDITLSGVRAGSSESVLLGTTTVSEVMQPFSARDFAWSIDLPDQYDEVDFADLTLEVVRRGVGILHAYMYYGGNSLFDLPVYSASFDRSVEVRVDDPGFAQSQQADLAEGLTTWSTSVGPLSAGSHTVAARATQGNEVIGEDAVEVVAD